MFSIKRAILYVSFCTLSFIAFSTVSQAQENQDVITVVKFDRSAFQNPDFTEDLGNRINSTLKASGTGAVKNLIDQMTKDPEQLKNLQAMSKAGAPVKIETAIHPNSQSALKWLNTVFYGMGMPNLELDGKIDSTLPDPQVPSPKEIRLMKWTRYLAGAGVGVVVGVKKAVEMRGAHDFLVLILPTVGIAVATVVLEVQFAHPKLNNFWSKVWKFGGPIGGRVTNLLANVSYGMTLFAAGELSSKIPELFGYAAAPFAGQPLPLFIAHALHQVLPLVAMANHPWMTALIVSAWGGAIYSACFGQFQTDLSIENLDRGSTTFVRKFGEETGGVIVNNGARVAGWVSPGDWSTYAMLGFLMVKTIPQLVSTHINTPMQIRKVHRLISPETAPGKNFFENCAEAIGKMRFINLPN